MTEAANPVLRRQFLEGMSHTACTVNVVTTDGPAGRAGVTVSAMSSVSADTPQPSLLVCVHHKSHAAQAIVENGVFCVNVLRDDQSHISDTFAGRIKATGGDKFACSAWALQKTGAPRVVDPLVAFDCKVMSGERIGTHHVFLGEVHDIFTAERGSPLIFANRAYGTAARITPTMQQGKGGQTCAHKLAIGCFHTFGPYVVPALVKRMARAGGVDVRLIEGDQRAIVDSLMAGEIELALLYDLDLDDRLSRQTLTALKPYVLLPEGHSLAEHNELSPHDLAEHPLVLLQSPPSRDYFLSIFHSVGLKPYVAYTSSSFEMVRGLVGHGMGYALLATKPASGMTYDGKALTTRPLTAKVETSRVVLAHKAKAPLSQAAEEFSRHCRSFFQIHT